MKMKIDTRVLAEQRSNRAWSQQELADISGVSVRTIQRIERTGVASADSVRAISSAFGEAPSFFRLTKQTEVATKRLPIAAFLFSLSVIIFGGVYFSQAVAEPIELDIQYRSQLPGEDSFEASWRYVVEHNKQSVLDLPNDLAISILPKLDGSATVLEVELLDRKDESGILNQSMPRGAGNASEGLSLSWAQPGKIEANVYIKAPN